MRSWHLIAVAVAVALVGAVAQASGTPAPQSASPTIVPPSITVNGSDSQTVAQGATDADRQTAYNTALGDALTAAQTKAAFVAGHEGVTLGALQDVTEQSDTYPGFCGDVVSPVAASTPGGIATVKSAPVGAHRNQSHKKKPVKGKASAAQAQVVQPNCPVQAQVTVTYLIAGASTTTTTSTTSTGTATPLANG